jgi:hypothetical protein
VCVSERCGRKCGKAEDKTPAVAVRGLLWYWVELAHTQQAEATAGQSISTHTRTTPES